jgi:competence protein ComEA
MFPALREALTRATARVAGSRFAKPVARVVLAAAGLLLLAFIGKTAVAGAMASSPAASSVPAAAAPSAVAAPPPVATPPAVVTVPVDALPAAPPAAAAPSSHARATADNLRRLPGVGEKRATAIVALRARLGGHFRAVEDLLKVKGIGRATLRRLRPLVHLDPPPLPADAGTAVTPG